MPEIKDATAVVASVAELGLLFLSDPKRSNAIQILTGEFPRGSWWSHPRAHEIYDVLQIVERHPDVLFAKLLAGKVTLIHRALWPALLAVVTAREPWQLEGLSPGATQALASLDEAEASAGAPPTISRTVTKELEARLLAQAESVHTSSGKHETRLRGWKTWAAAAGCPWPPSPPQGPPPIVAEAKQLLEGAAARLGPRPPLPWLA
jgi:hypothetical protein